MNMPDVKNQIQNWFDKEAENIKYTIERRKPSVWLQEDECDASALLFRSLKKAAGLYVKIGEKNNWKNLPPNPFKGIRWEDLFYFFRDFVFEESDEFSFGFPVPKTPESLALAMFNFTVYPEEWMKRTKYSLFLRPFKSSPLLSLYRYFEHASVSARNTEGSLWNRVEKMLYPGWNDSRTPMDILLAMAVSYQSKVSEASDHARELYNEIIARNAVNISMSMIYWVRDGGAYPTTFDFRAMLASCERHTGKPAGAVFNIPQHILELGKMYRLKPLNFAEPEDDTDERYLFGVAASTYLESPVFDLNMWAELSEDRQNIMRIKNIGGESSRKFRRELLKNGMFWSLPKTDWNMQSVFLNVACPASSVPPDDMRHPGKSEYFIHMPEDISLVEPVTFPDGHTMPLYRYFLNKNMLPFLAGSGFSYLDTDSDMEKASGMIGKILEFTAGESDGRDMDDWDRSSRAVILNIFLSGIIHPEMDMNIPFAPLEKLLGAYAEKNNMKMAEPVIRNTIRTFAHLIKKEAGQEGAGRDGAQPGAGFRGYLFSPPWDRDRTVRIVYSILWMAEKYFPDIWAKELEKSIGEPLDHISWYYETSDTGHFMPAGIPGLDEAFRKFYSARISDVIAHNRQENDNLDIEVT